MVAQKPGGVENSSKVSTEEKEKIMPVQIPAPLQTTTFMRQFNADTVLFYVC